MNSDSTQMNILQAYIKKNKQFVLLVLGMPCTSKSAVAKELVIDLGFLTIINFFEKFKKVKKNT